MVAAGLREVRIHNLRRTDKQWLRDATVDSTPLLLAVNNGCAGAVMKTSHTKTRPACDEHAGLDLIADFVRLAELNPRPLGS